MPEEKEAHILIDKLNFPEAPRWHNGAAWCVDGPRIWTTWLSGPPEIYVKMPCPMVLGIQFHKDLLLAAAIHSRQIYAVDANRNARVHADLSGVFEKPINEFVVHDNGNIYVGNMGFDPMHGEAPKTSRMAMVTPDGTVSLTGPELLFANGIEIAPDGQSLIVAESFAQRLTRIPVLADGTLGDAIPFADLVPIDGRPDGISMDSEGAIWFGDTRAGAVIRVAEGGEELDRVELPRPHVTSCALGGEDGRTLLFTATADMPDENLEEKSSGVLGYVRVTVPK